MKNLVLSAWKNHGARFSLICLSIWCCVAAVSVIWTPYPVDQGNGYEAWKAPSFQHWLGTDGVGRDMLSRLMAGSGTELEIVVGTCIVAVLVGIIGLVASLSASLVWNQVVIVAIDSLLSVPIMIIALILAIPYGASLTVIIVACGVSYGLNMVRIARPEALMAIDSDYAEAAHIFGVSQWQVLKRHVIPHIFPVFIVQITICAGTAILAESGLTYLGIGVPVGIASWGASLAASASLITVFPLTIVWPGAVIALAVFSLNVIGDFLRTALDASHIDSIPVSSDDSSVGGEE